VKEVRDKAHQAQAAGEDNELIFGSEFLEQGLLIFLADLGISSWRVLWLGQRTRGRESLTGWGAGVVLADIREAVLR
jgi:hypothetical protein